MNILRLVAELLLLYFLYKLIFDFIIPIYQTSKRVKKQFGEMQSKMQDQMNTFNQQQNSSPKGATSGKTTSQEPTKKEDYIDYEEVK